MVNRAQSCQTNCSQQVAVVIMEGEEESHPHHFWLQVSPFHQPEKGLGDAALQLYLHFQGITTASGKEGLQDTALISALHQIIVLLNSHR